MTKKKALPKFTDPHQGENSSILIPDQSADSPLAESCFHIVGIGALTGGLARLQKLWKAEILEPYRTQHFTRTGGIVEISIISNALVNECTP